MTTQMTVVTIVMNGDAPSPHVTQLLSSPALMAAALVQPLSVMATMTVETTQHLMKSIAVSDNEAEEVFHSLTDGLVKMYNQDKDT